MKKTKQLRKLLDRGLTDFILEAHNGISAKIVQEAGFRGIWASGLTISASLGVRDNNEASWTQILEILEFMSDATEIPILVDGDTGYGNFNNMRRLVRKLEQRGIAGVCIEDKLFPKTNSFIDSEQQPLADIEEFIGKIKAGKDSQRDDDFVIVARVEAFIAGWGLAEAIKRAEAYRLAGADAVLIHSKKNNPSDIESFMREWAGRHPVVIVPTKYYATPTERFSELGISLVIWANHLMRASIHKMQDTACIIYKNKRLTDVEEEIAPVAEIFKLQGATELQEAEKKYLPAKEKSFNGIILAASRGKELKEFTRDRPKALIQVNNKAILYSTVDTFKELRINKITVVRGYKKEAINRPGFTTVDNEIYEETRDLYSLYLARQHLGSHCLIAYGDCLYRKHLITSLLENQADIRVVVDADISTSSRKPRDLVTCSKPYSNDFFNNEIYLTGLIGDNPDQADGEWAGLVAASTRGVKLIKQALASLAKGEDFYRLSITDLLQELLKTERIAVVYTKGGWLDIDDLHDYQQAGRF